MEDFQYILDKTIEGAISKVNNQLDVIILTDLKRMSELGVLQVHKTQPEFEPWDNNKKSLTVSIGCRLYFKGEETISELKKENKELNQALNEILSELKERGGFDIFIKGIEKTLNK